MTIYVDVVSVVRLPSLPARSFALAQGYRHSPRHARRTTRVRASEESKPLLEIPESDADTSAVRKRKVKKRVQPEFYQSVQLTPTRKPVGVMKLTRDKVRLLISPMFVYFAFI